MEKKKQREEKVKGYDWQTNSFLLTYLVVGAYCILHVLTIEEPITYTGSKMLYLFQTMSDAFSTASLAYITDSIVRNAATKTCTLTRECKTIGVLFLYLVACLLVKPITTVFRFILFVFITLVALDHGS